MRKRPVLVVSACAAGALVLGVAVVLGAQRSLDRGLAAGQQSALPSSARTLSPSPTPSSVSSPPQTSPELTPVLAAVTDPATTNTTKLAERIAQAGSSGGKVGAVVVAADTGKVLYKNNAATTMIPASTNKLLTVSAALDLLGPQHRFATTVVATTPLPTPSPTPSGTSSSASPTSSPSPSGKSSPSGEPSSTTSWTGSIILVGGGDPYLTDAQSSDGAGSLQTLAAGTANRLKASGVTTVQLGYDASLFTGPAWNPDWPAAYHDVVTPTSALWVNEGRVGGMIGPRVSEPAEEAAEDFAAQLKKQGIEVTKIEEATAGSKAPTVATVESETLQRIVERLLMTSDNDAAEVILRQVAIASGQTGSIAAGVAAVRNTLTGLHAWVPTTHTYDGSGLARTTRVSANALVAALDLAASGKQPNLSSILTGLPVAGVEGSLHYRYGSTGATEGRGLVHAKTGTLHAVHSLAGYAYTPDHELLVFAFVVNDAKNDWSAVQWLDRVTAAVGSCGCTG